MRHTFLVQRVWCVPGMNVEAPSVFLDVFQRYPSPEQTAVRNGIEYHQS